MTGTFADPFVLRLDSEARTSGPLSGLNLAVKDNFDIAGHVTGAGNPEWAASHPPAAKTAPMVALLAHAGAAIVGKTQMDELAYSLMGVNARYGTPPNPASPERVPGGSSSGSAAAVAAGQADLGLGTDTGGSVRLPASFCGLWGWRATHGLLPADGMVPLAPSYDVPGLFTRDPATLDRAMALVLDTPASLSAVGHDDLWLPRDLWALAEPTTAAALRAALPDSAANRDTPLAPEGALAEWLSAFRVHQGLEAWRALGPWIATHAPTFGPGIADRFAMARAISPEAFATAVELRAGIRAQLSEALADGTILVIPTAPGPAPFRSTPQAGLEAFRNAALTLLCVAGHAGLPQISVPLARAEDAPVGLSLVGRAGSDRALLARAASLA